jgi:predicted nucleic acid-binding protein
MAMLNKEPGAMRVKELLQAAENDDVTLSMSLINLGELAYIGERRWGSKRAQSMLAYLEKTSIQMVEASKERIFAAAYIKAHHRLSYADAFAAALAQEIDGILLTSDLEFRSLGDQIRIEWLEK